MTSRTARRCAAVRCANRPHDCTVAARGGESNAELGVRRAGSGERGALLRLARPADLILRMLDGSSHPPGREQANVRILNRRERLPPPIASRGWMAIAPWARGYRL